MGPLLVCWSNRIKGTWREVSAVAGQPQSSHCYFISPFSESESTPFVFVLRFLYFCTQTPLSNLALAECQVGALRPFVGIVLFLYNKHLNTFILITRFQKRKIQLAKHFLRFSGQIPIWTAFTVPNVLVAKPKRQIHGNKLCYFIFTPVFPLYFLGFQKNIATQL